MSDEGQKFRASKQPKWPKLIMRAFTSPDHFAEWNLTPPADAGWFEYNFEAQIEDGMLHLNIQPTTMKPKD